MFCKHTIIVWIIRKKITKIQWGVNRLNLFGYASECIRRWLSFSDVHGLEAILWGKKTKYYFVSCRQTSCGLGKAVQTMRRYHIRGGQFRCAATCCRQRRTGADSVAWRRGTQVISDLVSRQQDGLEWRRRLPWLQEGSRTRWHPRPILAHLLQQRTHWQRTVRGDRLVYWPC